jgi:hypothetical protein
LRIGLPYRFAGGEALILEEPADLGEPTLGIRVTAVVEMPQ